LLLLNGYSVFKEDAKDFYPGEEDQEIKTISG
jgi:hypothetical protein